MKVLGLDSSTQSLSATLIDTERREVLREAAVHFDRNLSGYGTTNGVFRAGDAGQVHAPPMMWLDAMDLLFTRLQSDGVNLGEIAAISGSGQQHGSVYLNADAEARLAGLDPSRTLADQLKPCLSRETSPVWMDSSTSGQCQEITAAFGGAASMAEATGSTTFERFTGPQIR